MNGEATATVVLVLMLGLFFFLVVGIGWLMFCLSPLAGWVFIGISVLGLAVAGASAIACCGEF